MEHRKRSQNWQKVEISTLLRMVIAQKNGKRMQYVAKAPKNLSRELAIEALESLKECDHCGSNAKMSELNQVIEIY